MPRQGGTYALVLSLPEKLSLRIGRLGRFDFRPGGYVYIGSAFGPGGLAARVRRHWYGSGTCRWHIDYFRRAAALRSVLFTTRTERLEHQWAAAMLAAGKVSLPVPGFGASDCSCPAHLFSFPCVPDRQMLAPALGIPPAGASDLRILKAGTL